jgi:hypothetical protein
MSWPEFWTFWAQGMVLIVSFVLVGVVLPVLLFVLYLYKRL